MSCVKKITFKVVRALYVVTVFGTARAPRSSLASEKALYVPDLHERGTSNALYFIRLTFIRGAGPRVYFRLLAFTGLAQPTLRNTIGNLI